MSKKIKLARYEATIQNVINMAFISEVQNKILKRSSVIYVRLSDDLSVAKVYLDCYDRSCINKSVETANRLKGLFRSKVASALNIYKAPDLIFLKDESIDYAKNIENILKEINPKSAEPQPEVQDVQKLEPIVDETVVAEEIIVEPQFVIEEPVVEETVQAQEPEVQPKPVTYTPAEIEADLYERVYVDSNPLQEVLFEIPQPIEQTPIMVEQETIIDPVDESIIEERIIVQEPKNIPEVIPVVQEAVIAVQQSEQKPKITVTEEPEQKPVLITPEVASQTIVKKQKLLSKIEQRLLSTKKFHQSWWIILGITILYLLLTAGILAMQFYQYYPQSIYSNMIQYASYAQGSRILVYVSYGIFVAPYLYFAGAWMAGVNNLSRSKSLHLALWIIYTILYVMVLIALILSIRSMLL